MDRVQGKNFTRMSRVMAAAGLGIMLLAGCQNQPEVGGETFRPEDEPRAIQRFVTAQAAAGARADGMLYESHFDDDHLNSLGQDKLDLMLRSNDHQFPLVVYMSFPGEHSFDARKDEVSRYLQDKGLQLLQVRFEHGPNPRVASSAAQNLTRLSKTESESGIAGQGPVDPQGTMHYQGGGK